MEVGETHTRRQCRPAHASASSLGHLFSPSFHLPPLFPSFSFHLYRPVLALNRSANRLCIVATPQRPSVTFSALGSISPVIIGCPFCCGSTTIAAVSLQTGLLPLMSVENRPGPFFFVGSQMTPSYLMGCIDWASDLQAKTAVLEEVCIHAGS